MRVHLKSPVVAAVAASVLTATVRRWCRPCPDERPGGDHRLREAARRQRPHRQLGERLPGKRAGHQLEPGVRWIGWPGRPNRPRGTGWIGGARGDAGGLGLAAQECPTGEFVFGVDDDGEIRCAASGGGGDDCDDANPQIHPGAQEVVDEIDNDCDGVTDEEPAPLPIALNETDTAEEVTSSMSSSPPPSRHPRISRRKRCSGGSSKTA